MQTQTPQSSAEIAYRGAEPDDMKFILSSWKNSWRTCPWAGTVRNDEFHAVTTSTIEGLIARGAAFQVAVHTGTGRILGWICHEVLSRGEACVHYLYVKDFALRFGIGERLVEQVPGSKPGYYTHRYRQVVEACPGWRHAAEIARRK